MLQHDGSLKNRYQILLYLHSLSSETLTTATPPPQHVHMTWHVSLQLNFRVWNYPDSLLYCSSELGGFMWNDFSENSLLEADLFSTFSPKKCHFKFRMNVIPLFIQFYFILIARSVFCTISYADDTSLFPLIPKMTLFLDNLLKSINTRNWFRGYKFSLKVCKWKCHTNVTKYIGILTDKHLIWNKHIQHIIVKVSKACGIRNRLGYSLSRHAMITLYNTLNLPYFTHCNIE